MKQKKIKNKFEKKFKMADSKKLSFSTSPKAEQFPPKFHGLVLGLAQLNYAKGIGVDSLCRTASLLRIGGAGKLGFFESAILIFFFFSKKFFFFLLFPN